MVGVTLWRGKCVGRVTLMLAFGVRGGWSNPAGKENVAAGVL